MKGFKIRYYSRMRHIEMDCAKDGKAGPLIDYSWNNAVEQFLDQARFYGDPRPNSTQHRIRIADVISFQP